MTASAAAAEGHSVMSFDEAAASRRSVRAFRKDPVPRAVLEHIFGLANLAPSNCNTQPWYTVVASGATLERLREQFPADFGAGKATMDFPYLGKYDGVFKDRQYDAANRLYTAMNIARDDKAARGMAFMRNFSFFDAPHVAFLFMPEWCGIREAADVGMYSQTLMLALSAHGLASCPQTALSMGADLVRAELGVDVSYKLIFGISFGYEDTEHPANACRVPRAALADTTRFVD